MGVDLSEMAPGLATAPPHFSVDGLGGRSDAIRREPLAGRSAAPLWVDPTRLLYEGGHLPLILHEEAVGAVLDDLGSRAGGQREHGRAGGELVPALNGPCTVCTSGMSSRFAMASAVYPLWSCTKSNGSPLLAAASMAANARATWSASKSERSMHSGCAASRSGCTVALDPDPGAQNNSTS